MDKYFTTVENEPWGKWGRVTYSSLLCHVFCTCVA